MCKVTSVAPSTPLSELEESSLSARRIALLRMDALVESEGATGLPNILCDLLQQATSGTNLDFLLRILRLWLRFSRTDSTLAEELGRQGGHRLLVQIMNRMEPSEEEDTTEDEIQTVCCEIASSGRSFPLAESPFTLTQLRERLPFSYIHAQETVLIHQIAHRQSAQVDVGYVLWPSAVVLSSYLEQNAEVLSGTILELGSGCGLTGLCAAVQAQQNNVNDCRVTLTDFNPTVLENLRQNILLNDVSDRCDAIGLDFYQQSGHGNVWTDTEGRPHEPVDVVLAADVICQESDAQALSKTLCNALKPTGTAFVVCAKATHRFGVETLESYCHDVTLNVQVQDLRDREVGPLQETSGYVEGMEFTMFVIRK